MNVYPVPDALAPQYKGRGYVVATVTSEGSLTTLAYARDFLRLGDRCAGDLIEPGDQALDMV